MPFVQDYLTKTNYLDNNKIIYYMKQTTCYVSPEVELLTLTEWSVLCTSDQFDPNKFDAGQNEGITEKEYNW